MHLIKKLALILCEIFFTEGNDFFSFFLSFIDTKKRLKFGQNTYLVRLLFLSLLLFIYFVQKVFFFLLLLLLFFPPEINKQSQCYSQWSGSGSG